MCSFLADRVHFSECPCFSRELGVPQGGSPFSFKLFQSGLFPRELGRGHRERPGSGEER